MQRLIIMIVVLFAITFANLSCGTRSVVRHRPYPPQGPGLIIDVGIFYDELAPYGRWFQVDDYGWVWTPYNVPIGWRPYTDGYWVYTDYGWTWVSLVRWGWAPFHYGRWHFHARHGWIWLPGTVWGPAWVVWRRGPGWVGWAPMPPQRGWRVGLGFEIVHDPDRVVEPHWYNFVPDRNFADRDLNRRVELPARNVTLLRETQNVTNYSVTENRVVNRSFTTEPIERVTGRTVPQHRVVDSGAGQPEQVRGNDMMIYRPNVTPNAPQRSPRNIEPRPQRPATPAEIGRQEETERQKLEKEQIRTQQTLERQQQQEQRRVPAQTSRDEMQKRQEAERRALEEQKRREQEVLRSRQETRRQSEPAAKEPTSRTQRTERRTPPKKPEQKPEE